MAHMIWKETKQQQAQLGQATCFLCCCLVSFHFLWVIRWPHTVDYYTLVQGILHLSHPEGLFFLEFLRCPARACACSHVHDFEPPSMHAKKSYQACNYVRVTFLMVV